MDTSTANTLTMEDFNRVVNRGQAVAFLSGTRWDNTRDADFSYNCGNFLAHHNTYSNTLRYKDVRQKLITRWLPSGNISGQNAENLLASNLMILINSLPNWTEWLHLANSEDSTSYFQLQEKTELSSKFRPISVKVSLFSNEDRAKVKEPLIKYKTAAQLLWKEAFEEALDE